MDSGIPPIPLDFSSLSPVRIEQLYAFAAARGWDGEDAIDQLIIELTCSALLPIDVASLNLEILDPESDHEFCGEGPHIVLYAGNDSVRKEAKVDCAIYPLDAGNMAVALERTYKSAKVIPRKKWPMTVGVVRTEHGLTIIGGYRAYTISFDEAPAMAKRLREAMLACFKIQAEREAVAKTELAA